MTADLFEFDEPFPANGVPVEAEPLFAKAVRLLRFMDEFEASEHGTTVIDHRGQTIMLVKWNGDRHAHIDSTVVDVST